MTNPAPSNGDLSPRHIAERLTAPGPKRILSLDGGGARGLITVMFLKRIEDVLRQIHGRRDYVLSDYFDLIGGTSVGSMLATMLALGWEMDEVEKVFRAASTDIFQRSLFRWGLFRPRFSDHQLVRYLDRYVRDRQLDSPDFKTGLAIVAKRLDTGSAWVVYNNPHGKYWNNLYDKEGKLTRGNRYYKVKDLIRASTAAPTYFAPHRIYISEPTETDDGFGHFVDGGISPYNDPSLLLFMMAGVRGYRLGGTETVEWVDGTKETRGLSWQLGSDNLLIVSVGTGDYRVKLKAKWFNPAISFGGQSLLSLMADSQSSTLKLMQWLAKPSRPWTINSEVDDLRHDDFGKLIKAEGSMLSFTRYNVRLEPRWLESKLGETFPTKMLTKLRGLDYTHRPDIYERMADAAAARQVTRNDFPYSFNRLKL